MPSPMPSHSASRACPPPVAWAAMPIALLLVAVLPGMTVDMFLSAAAAIAAVAAAQERRRGAMLASAGIATTAGAAGLLVLPIVAGLSIGRRPGARDAAMLLAGGALGLLSRLSSAGIPDDAARLPGSIGHGLMAVAAIGTAGWTCAAATRCRTPRAIAELAILSSAILACLTPVGPAGLIVPVMLLAVRGHDRRARRRPANDNAGRPIPPAAALRCRPMPGESRRPRPHRPSGENAPLRLVDAIDARG